MHTEGRREPPFVCRPDITMRTRPMDSFVRVVRRVSQLCGVIAAGKKSQAYFAKEAKGLDDEMVKVFKANKVEVVTLTAAEYDQWVKVAQQSSYAEFATEVPDGKKLIDEALSVK